MVYGDVLEINIGVGLDKLVLEVFLIFRYKIGIEYLELNLISFLECVICLRNFEEDDLGCSLFGCGYSFYFECIDMWLYLYLICLLCCMSVGVDEIEKKIEVVIVM